ncbi:MAG: anhydro-N-acetylmuramic acid kinase [Bacteroidota bacterium]
MKIYRGIGVMSGSSMDGLDLAYCSFKVDGDKYSFELEQADQIPLDARWKSRLSHLPTQSAEIFAKTHVYFGHWLGEQVKQFIERYHLRPDFVAAHGQTIFHQPEKSFTTQIGDGETLVSYLPCLLVDNFRNKDVALKGQGAPLVPLGEKYLFPEYDLFLNLGGIANVTFQQQAFDICPCNSILNHLYVHTFPESDFDYDPQGQLASEGEVDEELLQYLNQLNFYKIRPPKSLGWEWTVQHMLPLLRDFDLPIEDLLCTLVEHIGFQIARAFRLIAATDRKLLITGGGRHHHFLISILKEKLAPLGIAIVDDFPESWIDYKEAIIFAFLGLRTLLGHPTTLASVTGAPDDLVTGAIHIPPSGGMNFLD